MPTSAPRWLARSVSRPDSCALLPALRYFEDGTCIVHHIFGGEVCQAVAAGYSDAYLAAHFEVRLTGLLVFRWDFGFV